MKNLNPINPGVVAACTVLIGFVPPATAQDPDSNSSPPVDRPGALSDIPRALPVAPTSDGDRRLGPDGFESPPVIAASLLLPKAQLSGPHFRVRNGVVTDGYLGHFVIDSDFGTYDCVGGAVVRQRIQEIAAIADLATLSKSRVFIDALALSAEKPVAAVKNIVTHPVGSVKKLPSTVGHFFQRAGRAIARGAESISEKISDGDLDGDAQQVAAAAKGVIGYNKALYEWAEKYSVDPYTDNKLLKDKVSEVAWVYYAGGLPITVGAAAISGGASLALHTTIATGLPSEVYKLTPAEILTRNRTSMEAMGVDASVRDTFENNTAMTPSLTLSIVSSLEGLAPATGRGDVIALAAGLSDRSRIQFLIRALRILTDRQGNGQSKITSFSVFGRLVAATDGTGALLVPAPVDYVSWTREVAAFANRPDLKGKTPVLLLRGGKFSDAAKEGFAAAGWRVGP